MIVQLRDKKTNVLICAQQISDDSGHLARQALAERMADDSGRERGECLGVDLTTEMLLLRRYPLAGQ